mmetsp:Transcript_23377/g.30528  ORF Transcript_23377/g.30528 Transcript_23377/m.30528 type:complete len:671 (+) Transcript_23377:168-2180(+)|eukprot:CAMPEP_0117740248 /NCGR_PEP_ID=MMETSP0947-20121206/4231_1 /TAXON_ID=44440 /ORGANISM="Chattonella subsalsa, Strain CCMP2191" /LENGTH=670 /DNA_ID=CAMNT_0005556331 /DNA_START=151 /DNA_END=2163 /DNA_ORIENTATION=-
MDKILCNSNSKRFQADEQGNLIETLEDSETNQAGDDQNNKRKSFRRNDKSKRQLKDGLEKKMEEQCKGEVISQIFGSDIGRIEEDFACAIEAKILLQGRMFIATSCVCFYSNIFGHEKKIILPWEGITCITKEKTALVIPNAIAIITGRREYIFRSFWDREEAFEKLQKYYRASQGLPPLSSEDLRKESSRAPIDGVPGSSLEVNLDHGTADSSAVTSGMDSPLFNDELHRESQTSELPEVEEVVERESFAESMTRSRGSEEEMATVENEAELRPVRPNPHNSSTPQTTPLQLLMAAKEAGGFMTTLAQGQLSLGLKAFYDTFLADSATFSLADFHRKNGDWDVEMTAWANQEEGVTRTLKFCTPINAPIGPSSTLTTKKAKLRFFEGAGILMESILNFADIPNADCFSVFERWIILPDEAQGVGASVAITFQCDVKFHKNLLWKKIIDSKTRADMKSVFESYLDHAQKHLRKSQHKSSHSDSEADADVQEPCSDAPPQAQAPKPVSVPLPWVLVGMMFLFQLYSWGTHVLAAPGPPYFPAPSGVSEVEITRTRLLQLVRDIEVLQKEMTDLRNDFDEISDYAHHSHRQWKEVTSAVGTLSNTVETHLLQIHSQHSKIRSSVSQMQKNLIKTPTDSSGSFHTDQLEKITTQLTELVQAFSKSQKMDGSNA